MSTQNFGAFIGDAAGNVDLSGYALTLNTTPGLTFTQAATQVVPGATSFSLRNNANNADNFIITNAGVATVRAGLTVTAGGLTVTAGGATITAGGLLVTAGRIREVMTPADVDAQNNTFTVAQAVGGIVVHTSATDAGTVTTDTAANFIAGSSGVGALTANGQTLCCYYVNDGDQTLTFAGGTGVTIADTGQTIAENESALVLIRRTGTNTVTMYIIGA